MSNNSYSMEDVSILESAKCREIVAEILNFGVNQAQIETLIKLLAMELENREKMLAIVELITPNSTPVQKNDIVI